MTCDKCEHCKKPSLAQKLVAEILYLNPKTPEEISSAVLRVQDILKNGGSLRDTLLVLLALAVAVGYIVAYIWLDLRGSHG
jgi:hypothetical protein